MNPTLRTLTHLSHVRCGEDWIQHLPLLLVLLAWGPVLSKWIQRGDSSGRRSPNVDNSPSPKVWQFVLWVYSEGVYDGRSTYSRDEVFSLLKDILVLFHRVVLWSDTISK